MPSDWVQDLDSFTPGAGAGPAKASPADELAAEMKLLNWHKLANEAALKAALIRNKRLSYHDKERRSKKGGAADKAASARMMQQIIEEEQSRPLEVGKDYIMECVDRAAPCACRMEAASRRAPSRTDTSAGSARRKSGSSEK